MSPLDFIKHIRRIYPERYAEFSGGCMKFALLLWRMFPESEVLYNESHTVIRYGGKCYDIDGEYEADVTRFKPLHTCDKDRILRSFDGEIKDDDEHLLDLYYASATRSPDWSFTNTRMMEIH